jgi:hypothetical protein
MNWPLLQAALEVRRWISDLSVPAPAIAELVQLDHVAARIIQEDLLEFRRNSLARPVRHAQPIELCLCFNDTGDSHCNVRCCRILSRPPRDQGREGASNEMDLPDLAHIHPVSGNSLDVRPALIGSEAQHIGIKVEDGFRRLPIDPYCVVVNFEDLDRHLNSPPFVRVHGSVIPRRQDDNAAGHRQGEIVVLLAGFLPGVQSFGIDLGDSRKKNTFCQSYFYFVPVQYPFGGQPPPDDMRRQTLDAVEPAAKSFTTRDSIRIPGLQLP